MAFDYGSIDLGLKNPFKLEGKVTAIRGAIQVVLGVFLLITAAGVVKDDSVSGWVLMIFGVLVLGAGIRALSGGIYATLRYFVGRNHPTSLAINYSKSESSTSSEESSYVGYDVQQLEEMLVGRKNSTFVEPRGFLARLLHSFIPRLLYMPYPIRNLAQNLFMAWVNTFVSLVLYAIVAFVSLGGFAGDAGEIAFPIYSILLMFYLLLVWYKAGRPVARNAEKNVDALGVNALTKIISLAVILPIITGLSASWVMKQFDLTKADIQQWMEVIPELYVPYYLVAILLMAGVSSAIILMMLQRRLQHGDPMSEVSELRENWQESVHPNEIFINLDNLVMANRRYKEVPNRVYRVLEPDLNEQVSGKGDFYGEMIQEVQPRVKEMDLGDKFRKLRLISLVSGNILFIVSTIFTILLAYSIIDLFTFFSANSFDSLAQVVKADKLEEYADVFVYGLHMLLISILFKSFGSLLSNSAHLLFAEIQFDSLLVYFKCEGTFTESKISTGTGIHDSTRSENTLVRSSITPWVIVSRIVSSTFAATGLRNLEHPRHILEMHKDDGQLEEIKRDLINFLKDRESIAAITSARDLGNASQIHQLNEQTRATHASQSIEQDVEAAGYLRKEQDLNPVKE